MRSELIKFLCHGKIVLEMTGNATGFPAPGGITPIMEIKIYTPRNNSKILGHLNSKNILLVIHNDKNISTHLVSN
jgi:hypothetical protein